MRTQVLRNLLLLPALALATVPAFAEQVQTGTGLQRMARPAAPAPLRLQSRPLLVIPPASAHAPAAQLRSLPPGLKLSPAQPLSDAEKADLLKQAQQLAIAQGITVPTGILSKVVLTPMKPYLPNQASVLFDSGMYGYHADGAAWASNGPYWSLAGKSAGIGIEFLPFKAGQIMIVVYNLTTSTHSSYVVAGGYPAQAIDNKVVFALTPQTTGRQFAGLAHTTEGQYSLISSVEIFVAQ